MLARLQVYITINQRFDRLEDGFPNTGGLIVGRNSTHGKAVYMFARGRITRVRDGGNLNGKMLRIIRRGTFTFCLPLPAIKKSLCWPFYLLSASKERVHYIKRQLYRTALRRHETNWAHVYNSAGPALGRGGLVTTSGWRSSPAASTAIQMVNGYAARNHLE